MGKTEEEIMTENAEGYMECTAAIKLGISKFMELENATLGPGDLEFFAKVDVSISDHTALTSLLISKGIIEQAEYYEAVRESAEERVKFWEELIREKHRIRITLL